MHNKTLLRHLYMFYKKIPEIILYNDLAYMFDIKGVIEIMRKRLLCITIVMLLMVPLLSLTAVANDPPLPPTIDGPPSGTVGTTYEYEFCGEDPNQDDIVICVNWGDDTGTACFGPFPSGTCIQLTHAWEAEGTYTITAYCTDIHEAQSDNATFQVQIKKSRDRFLEFDFILQFLKHFPIICRFLGL